jgi:hypothetical protein
LVGFGGALLLISPLFGWFEPHAKPTGAIAALVLGLGLVTVVLVITAASSGQPWPYLYSRVAGSVALVAVAYEVFHRGRPIALGVFVAGVGAAMIAAGSASAAGPHAEAARRSVRNR